MIRKKLNKKIVLSIAVGLCAGLFVSCGTKEESEDTTGKMKQNETTVEETKDTGKDISAYADWIDSDTGKYQYPVVPGTSEWASLTSSEEMVKACTIPEALLADISTEDLLDLVLQYPLLSSYELSSQNAVDGFEAMITDFNGLKTLLTREDLKEILLSVYETWDLRKESDYNQVEILELLLLRPDVVTQLQDKEKAALAKAVYEQYIKKAEVDAYIGSEQSAYLYAVLYGTEDVIADYNEITKKLCKELK